ncbi:MAG TPA: prenyltransferase/squalene oxidase repeat-containing protein, partial [Bryobacteraceae bacterium]|nr:prenyltransferase/squalene oxidase repeat-containing protein [Bryobacteraceae bacterium]
IDRLVQRLERDRSEWESTPQRGVRALLSSEVASEGGGQLLAALMAALGNKPKLLDPLREHYRQRQRLIERDAADPVGAVVALLAAEGLVLCDELGLITLSPEKREGVVHRILASTEKNKEMREEIELIRPARASQAAESLALAQAELHQLGRAAKESAEVAADALVRLQDPAGFWRGDLTADTTLESDYILLLLWLHPAGPGGWNPPRPDRIRKAMARILDQQLPDGGWNIYAGGPSELNATARAYTALKIGGMDPRDPVLERARHRVLTLGGLQAANSYTKINLSLFGLFPRQFTPSVPPELVMIPGNLLYEMSSWTRAIIVPLSIVQASGVERPVPPGMTVEELYIPGQPLRLPKKDRLSAVFNQADRAIKLWERRGVKDIRAKAIREAEKWMLEHTRFSDGVGAIYPSIMYSIMAMDALGYERDQPDLEEAIRQFESLILETGDRLQFQPCVSPVWDTAIAMFALGELGQSREEEQRRAADWLLEKEVRRKGDWSVKRPALTPGGWAFEFANEYYPDIDDTAMVLLALEHAQASDPERQKRAERRAVEWLLGMQSSDGGWAAFDVDNNWELLNKVPFADHNAMLDPTCPDITGRVLEALCRRGFSHADPAIARAVQYLVE